VLALMPELRRHFGDCVFKDTDNIPPGEDFVNNHQHIFRLRRTLRFLALLRHVATDASSLSRSSEALTIATNAARRYTAQALRAW